MIEIENLSKYFRGKRFKKVQAVNGVSFTVRDG
jgi:ABC-type oligopeptide transport system ATPase subunit